MKGLKISPDLTLPLDAVTETFGILAKRGAGKSYTAGVLVEEMLGAGMQVVILDPMGIWWGLRTAADGKSPGFQIPILGGDRGDVPLDPKSGKLIADLAVDERLSMVIDVKAFSKGDRKTFVVDFAERLYRRNRAPMHLVLEEADMFAPQKPQKGEERMLGAIEDIVRRGRSQGIGVTLITQRSAVLNKDVLTQTECLIAMRTTGPHDLKAVRGWIEVHADPADRDAVMSSLPGLRIGTAWVCSPGWLEKLVKVQVRKKRTYDSSATPVMRGKVAPAKTIADVDLGALTVRMAETIERAKAEDPKELHKRIRELEAQAKKLEAGGGGITEADVEKRIKAAVAEATRELELKIRKNREWTELRDKATVIIHGVQERLADLTMWTAQYAAKLTSDLDEAVKQTTPQPTMRLPRAPERPGKSPKRTSPQAAPPVASRQAPREIPGDSDGKLSKAELAILRSLWWLKDEEATPTKVGFYAGYASNGGYFLRMLGQLRTAGLAEGWRITEAGKAIMAPIAEPKPTGHELREWLRPKLNKLQNEILDVLIEAGGERLSSETIASQLGKAAEGGYFIRTLGTLRTIEAAQGTERDGGTRAHEVFFE